MIARAVIIMGAIALSGESASAQSDSQDLATKLANPVASLISVPLQNNIDCCYGPDDATRYTLNVQPVIPVSIAKDWNVIVRTIVPFISLENTPSTPGATGFGDITQSFFFSPREAKNGVVWALGPVFLWPIGESELGSEKWGAGPTGLLLKQTKTGLTFGVLANHIWSYAGNDNRDDISSTFIQPFFSKNWPNSTSVTINSETSYDWEHEQWTIPVNLTLGHIYKIGKQPVQISGTARYYVDKPEGGPEWGARLTLTFLFPG